MPSYFRISVKTLKDFQDHLSTSLPSLSEHPILFGSNSPVISAQQKMTFYIYIVYITCYNLIQ